MRIGIDFDNTIAGYDRLFGKLAVQFGLVDAAPAGGKAAVRRLLRARGPAGEQDWQMLQAIAYGARMAEAELIAGVGEFLTRCRERGVPVFIVSHKTRYAHRDPAQVDLRQAALGWMRRHGFFASDGFALDPGQVYFEPTRSAKLARIAALGCSHFIDDLVEVFAEPDFPGTVDAILFDPAGTGAGAARCRALPHWDAIREAVLDTRH